MVPLNTMAMTVIESLGEIPADQPLFDIPQRNRVSVAFARAARKVRKGFRFHDLRHTFASWMVMSGANLRTVADILGHDIKMAMRYAKLSPEFREREAGRLDPMFAGLLTSATPQLVAEGDTA